MRLFSVEHLCKRFGGTSVADDLSLHIEAGECLGVIGPSCPNGAGKTTTIRMWFGEIAPDGGTIAAFGLPIPQRVREAKHRIGVVTQTDSRAPASTTLAYAVVGYCVALALTRRRLFG